MSKDNKSSNSTPARDSDTGGTFDNVGGGSVNYSDLVKSEPGRIFEVQNSMPPPPPLPTKESDS